jgi:hypothetical protein
MTQLGWCGISHFATPIGDSGQTKNSIPPTLTGSSRLYVGMSGPTI